jgi:metal-responsive CopG/Arc/MetJ family transcriptional regulator
MKMNITISDELYDRLVDYAEKNYFNKSTLISFALTDYLNQKQMISAISDMSVSMRRIADSGTIDEQTKKDLERFETLASMLSGK